MTFEFRRPPAKASAGQAAVETAIVMPLHLFLLLGIIQYGMISQARYMAKYAAYRAVRVGAMNNGDTGMMKKTAVQTLLPVLYIPFIGGAVDVNQDPTDSPPGPLEFFALKHLEYAGFSTISGELGFDPVKVVVCGPVKDDVSGFDQNTLTGVGSKNQIDFDDPRASTEWSTGVANSSDSLKAFTRTKLRVQVQLLYIMPIPFADWIINRTFLAMSLPSILRMGASDAASRAEDYNPNHKKVGGTSVDDDAKNAYNDIVSAIWKANQVGVYAIPIFESYSMRMQSNLFTKNLDEKDKCVTYGAFKSAS